MKSKISIHSSGTEGRTCLVYALWSILQGKYKIPLLLSALLETITIEGEPTIKHMIKVLADHGMKLERVSDDYRKKGGMVLERASEGQHNPPKPTISLSPTNRVTVCVHARAPPPPTFRERHPLPAKIFTALAHLGRRSHSIRSDSYKPSAPDDEESVPALVLLLSSFENFPPFNKTNTSHLIQTPSAGHHQA